MACIIRLLDLEGRVVRHDLAAPNPPPQYVHLAATRFRPSAPITEHTDPAAAMSYDTITYERERQDGGGTWIYRRITPLWRSR